MSRIRADRLTNKEGTGAPLFPNGIRVVGLTSLSNVVAGVTTFTSDVSIGGTLTYEDVTNIDSVGMVTARSGIDINAGGLDITAGGANIVGVVTAGSGKVNIDSNGNITAVNTAAGGQSVTLNVGASNASGVNDGIIKIVNGGTGNGVLQWDYEGNANRAQIYVYRSDQELRFTTAGGERLRIGAAGQLGIAGANYGTAGQVLSSQGASAAPQWATPAGGAWTVLSHDNFATTNGTTSESRGWTSDYVQVKAVWSYLTCGNTTGQTMNCQFYMDTSLGTQGTLITSNNYYYTGFPMDYYGNSNNNWYNGYNVSWFLQNGASNARWCGEIIFPIPTGVGASGAMKSGAYGRTNTMDRDDRCSCIMYDSAQHNKIIVGAKISNMSGNNWTEGTTTWYGLKKS